MALARRMSCGNAGVSDCAVVRPPWTVDEAAFADICDQCGSCLEACPEGLIGSDANGFPVMNFQNGACVFCGACASACERGAYGKRSRDPWTVRAVIGMDCLNAQGRACHACGDFCEEGAIRFVVEAEGRGMPRVRLEDCTGCGACVAPCPVGTIQLMTPPMEG